MSIYKKIQYAAIFLQELDKIGELNSSKLDDIDNLPNNPPFKNFIKIRIIHNQIYNIKDDLETFFNNWILNENALINKQNFNTYKRIWAKAEYMDTIIKILLIKKHHNILYEISQSQEGEERIMDHFLESDIDFL
jgi:hypothetical protein